MGHRERRSAMRGTAIVKVVSIIVFLAFAFVYIHFYQADLLMVAQHCLSEGQTHYEKTFGTPVIMLVLWLLQIVAYSLVRLECRLHFITYIPSMLLLLAITYVRPDGGSSFTFGPWPWLFPLSIVVWYGLARLALKIQNYELAATGGLFSRAVWINVMALALMSAAVGLISNGNDVLHYRIKAESRMAEGKWEEALQVGSRSMSTDSCLTMIRSYSLARQGLMGERLFRFPLAGTSESIVPKDGGSHFLYYPVDSLYKFLGAIPRKGMTSKQYLRAITKHGQATDAVADYVLCSCLIDRDLDAFARNLTYYYEIGDSLPLHYKEALVLYSHLRSEPLITYSNSVMDADYDDFRNIGASGLAPSARRLQAFDHYYGTYWWYYEYNK